MVDAPLAIPDVKSEVASTAEVASICWVNRLIQIKLHEFALVGLLLAKNFPLLVDELARCIIGLGAKVSRVGAVRRSGKLSSLRTVRRIGWGFALRQYTARNGHVAGEADAPARLGLYVQNLDWIGR